MITSQQSTGRRLTIVYQFDSADKSERRTLFFGKGQIADILEGQFNKDPFA
jgi:hypothetical protein